MTTATASKSQQAYEFVREQIRLGHFPPGYHLVLATVAAQIGVSVVPVREAIRRLQAEGLVSYERNVGAQVAMLDEGKYVHAMQSLALVEGYATALSAPLLSPEQLQRARIVNDRMRTSLVDFQPHAFTELNLEFHTILFEQCRNPDVLGQVHRGWARMASLRDSTFSFVPGRARQSVDEHDRLVALISQRAQQDVIEQAARSHRLATLDAFLAYQDELHSDPLRERTFA